MDRQISFRWKFEMKKEKKLTTLANRVMMCETKDSLGESEHDVYRNGLVSINSYWVNATWHTVIHGYILRGNPMWWTYELGDDAGTPIDYAVKLRMNTVLTHGLVYV